MVALNNSDISRTPIPLKAEHLTVKIETDAVSPVFCDIPRIKFVLKTLIENAERYTLEGGTISVAVKRNGNEVICGVSDTGMGFSKEESSLLFSKFYRSKSAQSFDTEGMGIGLYISKEIIKRHNGKIWAQSEGLDKGSSFFFSLPAKE